MIPSVLINGESKNLEEGATLLDAIVAAGAPEDGRGVAVAVNGEVIPRALWGKTHIRIGQHIEVLHAVQGG